MPAPRTVVAALLLAAAVPSPAHAAGHPAPVAHCIPGDVYKFEPYVAYAYTTDSETPVRTTVICHLDNGWEQATGRATEAGPAAAFAGVGTMFHADSIWVCVTALAEYADGSYVEANACAPGQV